MKSWSIAASAILLAFSVAPIAPGQDPDLVLHYNFNEGAGNLAKDLSNFDNNGTIISDFDPLWVEGVEGHDTALKFDGDASRTWINAGNDAQREHHGAPHDCLLAQMGRDRRLVESAHHQEARGRRTQAPELLHVRRV